MRTGLQVRPCMLLIVLAAAVASTQAALPRPAWKDRARMARWLVHVSDWGTLSVVKEGKPLAGVVSVADGSDEAPTGRLLFYLSPLDAVSKAALATGTTAFSVSEAQRLPGGCGSTDPEDPTCAKVTLLGRMAPIPNSQLGEAQRMLFERHPAMEAWPADHRFAAYELHVEEALLLDWYGGMARISADDYFAADPRPASDARGSAAAGQQQQAAGVVS